MIVSIIVPFLNEQDTIALILEKVLHQSLPSGWEREIILVDDGSTDLSLSIAKDFAEKHPKEIRVFSLEKNFGKGYAVRVGMEKARGDVFLIQDADLEYDPADYVKILCQFADPRVQVVYGSRILGSLNYSYLRYYWGGRFLSFFTNLLYGSHITDEPTCYKAFRREIFRHIDLKATGFEFCPEITGKVLRSGLEIHEVPIQYNPRGFEKGKKIRMSDGIRAMWTLFKIRFALDKAFSYLARLLHIGTGSK